MTEQWWTWVIGLALSVASGIATSFYYLGRTNERIQRLEDLVAKHEKSRKELEEYVQTQIQQAVYAIRAELNKQNAFANQTCNRMEERLNQLDTRFESRLIQLIDLVVHPDRRVR